MNCFSYIEFHPVSAVFNEGKLFHNIYDASGERTLKAQGEYKGLFENGVPTDGGVQLNAYNLSSIKILRTKPFDLNFLNRI
ncbi:MAG: hypothetical protein WDA08_09970 [Weeksellaceae bacterium]